MQVFRDYRLIECETTMRRLTPIAIREVAVFDTEDVAPVVHAHWYHKPHVWGVDYCSNCDFELHINDTKYCPYCGAKMDEEMRNET